MRVLTAEQTKLADLKTIEDGVPGIALMENAAHRVSEVLEREFDPITAQKIVILCGKGNNGGDGLALARILKDRGVERLSVVLGADPSEYKGDAATNLARLQEVGLYPSMQIPEKLRERRVISNSLRLGESLVGGLALDRVDLQKHVDSHDALLVPRSAGPLNTAVYAREPGAPPCAARESLLVGLRMWLSSRPFSSH